MTAILASACLAVAAGMVGALPAQAENDPVRTFDGEQLGVAPEDCTSFGDVSVEAAEFGSAAVGNRALRIWDQSTSVHMRTTCHFASSSEKSVSFDFAPRDIAEQPAIIAVMGESGAGNGVYRLSFGSVGDELVVRAYDGTAWRAVATLPGVVSTDAWIPVTINATTDRAEIIVAGVAVQTTTQASSAAALGDVFFASAGTAVTGTHYFVDNLGVSSSLPDTAFSALEIEPLLTDAMLHVGQVLTQDEPVARFLLPETATVSDYEASVRVTGQYAPAQLSGPDPDGYVSVLTTATVASMSGSPARYGDITTMVKNSATGLASTQTQQIIVDEFPTVLAATAEPGTQIRFPDVITLADGRLLAVYHEAAGHVDADGVIKQVVSSDDGVTWSSPSTVVEIEHDARDPKIVQLADGTLILNFFEYQWGSSPLAVQTFTVRSTDNGATWSAPAHVATEGGGWTATHGAIVEADNGDLLLPLYRTRADDGRERATVIRSVDGGLTWPAQSEVTIAVGAVRFQEPNLTVLPSGEIVSLIRTWDQGSNVAYISRSTDHGASWTTAEPTDLPAESHHQLLTSSGELLLTYGDYTRPGRPTWGVLIEDPAGSWNGYVDNAVELFDSGDPWDQANPSSAEVAPGEFVTMAYDVQRGALYAVFTSIGDYPTTP